MFRKELRKWKYVLWPVFLSLAASSLVVLRQSSVSTSIARVNGHAIDTRTFASKLALARQHIAQLKNFARSMKISPELFLGMNGISNAEQYALDQCIKEKVYHSNFSPLAIKLHPDVVSDEIAKALPSDFIDDKGNPRTAPYKQYLQTMNMNIVDYENDRIEDMKRNVYETVANFGAYTPSYWREEGPKDRFAKKSFVIVKLSHEKEKAMVQLTDTQLEQYYKKHTDRYRTEEKRTVGYLVVTPSKLSGDEQVSDVAVKRFYDKNKTTLFRVAPRVKVRRIALEKEDEAEDVLRSVKKSPESFAAVMKKHQGEELDFFARGTHNKDFETAAFRLQEKGQLSDVVKTDKGYEILQLVDRIAAREKPIDDVRDEIITAIRSKRAVEKARIMVSKAARHGIESDEYAQAKSEAARTGRKEVTLKEAGAGDFDALLAKHAFDLKGTTAVSYFLHDGSYILIDLREVESSRVKEFAQVRSQVADDYAAEKAQQAVASKAKIIHRALRAGTAPEVVAKSHNAQVIEDNDVSRHHGGTVVGVVSGLGEAAFDKLIDPSLVLLHRDKEDVYLVMCKEQEEQAQDQEKSRGDARFDSSFDRKERQHTEGFIAALMRNATVHHYRKI